MKAAHILGMVSVAVMVGAFGTGCSNSQNRPATTSITSAQLGAAQTPARADASAIRLSAAVRKQCGIKDLASVSEAPKFYYDQSELMVDDRNLLARIAECVTTGALKGHSVTLVGHADSRGTDEHNMALGAQRADAVFQYLAHLGVAQTQMKATSRGALDATGQDLQGQINDRRVDIDLQ
jgi:peptidoglycan-associated lipoprotein